MGLDLYVALFDAAQYRQRVEPALRKYFANGEYNDVLLLLQEVKHFSGGTSDEIQSSVNILNGDEFYGPSVNHIPPSPDSKTNRQDLDNYVRGTVVGQLLEGLCVPKIEGVRSEQNMGRSVLIPYLYEHSSWIENALTGGILDKGTRLDFPLGEHAEIMASEIVNTLLSELNAVPPPDPDSMPGVAKQLSNLRRILETAACGSGQAALLYIG